MTVCLSAPTFGKDLRVNRVNLFRPIAIKNTRLVPEEIAPDVLTEVGANRRKEDGLKFNVPSDQTRVHTALLAYLTIAILAGLWKAIVLLINSALNHRKKRKFMC